ncbi:MAG: hypothetical protein A2418_01740 [Candidatus Brennerbacteria bacterium RIFOXYC1_FULL_41_11]|nr:MAG: hypothetical protein UU61_C0008G0002 [Parcubacteria group bacterium GW2011_GWB1_41_4]OGY38961.1 MAG: hypothetical protein A2418_01740 [Candidatus Brennerbacteria bacterium RIFOXYC1_FULL_41_11]
MHEKFLATNQAFKNGFSAIALTLGISLIVTVLSMGMGFLSYLENSSSFSRLKGQEAFWVAESGIYDAIYRLSLNKNFSSAGYNLAVGNGSTTVVVETDAPQTNFSMITSTGIVSNARKKIQANIVRDVVTGKLTIVSWQESAL